jgi:hypothetical protein
MLVYREVVPRFQAGEPPPFTIPLTAEVSGESVDWHVLQKGEKIGDGRTKISLESGRTFELSARFSMKKLSAFEDVKLTSAYSVTEEGRLLSGSANVKLAYRLETRLLPIEIDFRGEVREQMFHPKLAVLVSGLDVTPYTPTPIPVSESGSVVNPMHLVHKISGLRAGQSWVIPLMDPLSALPSDLLGSLPGKPAVVNQVFATVMIDDLPWHGEKVACFKIEYAKPNERPSAATWVRRRDDAVLQQWAAYEGFEYILQRAPQK